MKIVTVCGLGMGSSMMLKMTVQDVLDKNKIKAKVESTDLGSAKSMNADIYVLSNDLAKNASEFNGTIAVIKNIADEDEVEEKLLEAINKNK